VQFAKVLRQKLRPADCEICLFNRENHMVFHPLLADVAGASINADAAAAPLRQMLPGVECRTERVERINLAMSEIEFEDGNGTLSRLGYDQVVVACGAESNLGIIPGMTEHAFAFKVMRDAIELRQHLVRQMELAEATTDAERRRWHLSFIVVGAGFSGVEVAGEINELVRSSTRFYRNFRKEDVVVSMVHSQDQILPEVAPNLRDFAKKKMEKAGVTMLMKTRAVAATHEGIELSNGKMLTGGTIVCTIGTAISPLVQHLDVPKERGRIRTTPDMRIEGFTNAWAVGDCAQIINAIDGKPSAPTGQFAERQGKQAALNLARIQKGEPTHPFSFKVLGQLCSIGGYSAVAEMFGMRISGFLAWALWRGVYLFKLPTWSRRIKVAFDWGWDFIFPRDLGFLNTNETELLTHSFYRAGDFIHRQGEPARVFSVIEEGDVEVLQSEGDRPAKILAVLGTGDFFGEGALLGNRPHETSVRARTTVRLHQMGSALFSQITGSFALFRQLLADAVTHRSGDFWSRLPDAKALLDGEPLALFVDVAPLTLSKDETTFEEAIKALNESPTGQFLIVDEKQQLWGTFDRSNLYQIVVQISLVQADKRADFRRKKLAEILPANSLFIAQEDSIFVGLVTMQNHNISWIPVVKSKSDLRPVGLIRGERISARMIEKIALLEAGQAKAAS
jgi:NADH dehydrogenase